MKHVTLAVFAIALALMTGCACMTCPMYKKSQAHQTAQDYVYEFKTFYINNVSSSSDIDFQMNRLDIKMANADVVSVSIMPDTRENVVQGYNVFVTYKKSIKR